jgi:Xaa-Pro aminopeptidase
MRKEIIELRRRMQRDGVDVCIVPTSDPHGSEYIHPHFEARRFFSGFTGDAGTLMVTQDEAALWTDGRFFLQASQELEGTGIELMRSRQPGVPTLEDHIAKIIPEGGVLAFDGELVTAMYGELLKKKIAHKHGTIRYDYDPAEGIWQDRPAISPAGIWPLSVEYAGRSAAEKLADVREEMAKAGADCHVIASLDDIAWLFNLRGGDIPRNPVFFAWCLIEKDSAGLYMYGDKLTGEARLSLEEIGVSLRPYEDIWRALAGLGTGSAKPCVLIDPAAANYRIMETLSDKVRVIRRTNPTSLMKHIKNDVEIGHIMEGHRKDGTAMVRFLCWLDGQAARMTGPDVDVPGQAAGASDTADDVSGHAAGMADPAAGRGAVLTEISASDKLESFRAEQEGFIDLSFDTIAGYAEHGAIIHYSATTESDARLRPEGFFLVDSGGQYLDGTTDITRTIALGPLTDEMKKHYTLVLKCNLAMERAIFPEGTRGESLDVIARQPLWSIGLDYRHGTGHGVGYLLNVHEGPNGLHSMIIPNRLTCPFEPGMVTTNEPGYYRDGHYGIRIENELLCVPHGESEYGKFYTFKNITLCPYDLRAVCPELMTDEEIEQVNRYHARVYEELSGRLNEDEKAWLRRATSPISRHPAPLVAGRSEALDS